MRNVCDLDLLDNNTGCVFLLGGTYYCVPAINVFMANDLRL